MLRKETSFSLLCQLYLNEKISGSYEKDYVGKHTSRQKVIKEHKLKLLKTIISEINSLNSTINERYFSGQFHFLPLMASLNLEYM